MNKYKYLSLLGLFLCPFMLFGATIHYKIDLTNTAKGMISVEISNLNLSDDLAYLIFPKVIPGMYEQSDYGKYIYNVVAEYENGNKKNLYHRKNINYITVKDASRVVRIRYDVRQTNPARRYLDRFFLPAGSVFSDAYSLINFHAVVGFFPSLLKDVTYEIAILKNDSDFGVGSANFKSTSPRVDTLVARSYHELIDAPMLYSQYRPQDTLTISENGIRVKVAVTPNELGLDTELLKDKISKILRSLSYHPTVSKVFPDFYSLLFCIDADRVSDVGGLEHGRSSVYFLRDTIGLDDMLNSLVVHELLHVLTPLHIRSQYIDNFNYLSPAFSKHLWLYEGITEYLSLKCNLDAGLIDTTQFFLKLNAKNISAERYQPYSMTTASSEILKEKYQSYFSNFYMKGALVGFYLDYSISKASNGNKGIFDLLDFLLEKYALNQPFPEGELFSDIENEFPETTHCFNQMVIGTANVPLKKIYDEMGIEFRKSTVPKEVSYYDIGINSGRHWVNSKFITIKKQPLNDRVGKRKLNIYYINNEPVDRVALHRLIRPSSPDTILLGIDEVNRDKTITVVPQLKDRSYYPTEVVYHTDQNQVLNKIFEF